MAKTSTKRPNAYRWLLEPLMDEASYHERHMFGCLACYLNGRLVAVLADRDRPWDGFLVPTDRSRHPSLITDWPALTPHPVLGKWLYLAATAQSFESTAMELVDRIQRGDARFGVTSDTRAAGRRRRQPRRSR
jgi:hypothetical protein